MLFFGWIFILLKVGASELSDKPYSMIS